MFQTELDIANRALQQCGVRRIASFTDQSANAQEIAFNYHKLRVAELRRNIWGFAIRRAALRAVDTNTMTLVPQPWVAGKIYVVGSLVTYSGKVYLSLLPANQNNTPGLSPAAWGQYFGPLTVTPWQTGLAGGYYAGELVYYPTQEAPPIYMSLVSGNADTPGVYPAWSSTTIYQTGDTVTTASGLKPLLFDPGSKPVSFDPGSLAMFFDTGVPSTWQSLKDLNVGISPGTDPTSWVGVPVANQVGGQTGQHWLQLDSAVKALHVIYPLGAGPLSQSNTRNIFRLPNGFLREAPQLVRSGTQFLGAPTGLQQDDWEYDDQYIVSMDNGPITVRFVADVADVTAMDPMFCEGLAARIALETVEGLTENVRKRVEVQRRYNTLMGEARAVSSIEQGPVTPVMNRYVACRY